MLTNGIDLPSKELTSLQTTFESLQNLISFWMVTDSYAALSWLYRAQRTPGCVADRPHANFSILLRYSTVI